MSAAALPPIDSDDRLAAARESWHALAEHVLSPARYRADRHIGLLVTPGGFGTPRIDGLAARVAGTDLVVEREGVTETAPLTTIGAAAAAVGIEPGPTGVYPPTTTLAPDAPLALQQDAVVVLATWYEWTWGALADLRGRVDASDGPSDLTLWPEHFDVAFDAGDDDAGRRGTFGASPGDALHLEPYLYVTHWADVPNDPYWNETAFAGASLGYRALTDEPDAAAAMRRFFNLGRARLQAR